VSVDAGPALAAPRARAAELRRQFHRSLAGGLLAAALAGACVVLLVARSGKLARDRARFAAAAAHELRTPLAGIRLHGEMLAHALGHPARARQYAQRIGDEAERLGRLVANVLAHAQADQSRLRLNPAPGDLGATVRDAVALIDPMIAAAGATLALAVDPDLPPAAFDRDAVHQIVRNLVDNAEKYARGAADRRIDVRVTGGPGAVALMVRDRGPGVSPRRRRELFRPFVRPERGAPVEGLGLGLSVVRSLAEAQGARVFHDEAAGGGAMFVVTFPVSDRAARAGEARAG
jgi:signal transduction histidine kinase